MKWTVQHAVIATLAYADLFDYPLTRQEISRWLITDSSQKPLYNNISSDGTYFALSFLQQKVVKRRNRQRISEKKFMIAQHVARLLAILPGILLIGVSGGLAMKNADEEDDIDFFIIVRPGTLWITRLSILAILELLGRRRRVGDRHIANTICVNMLIDAHHLMIPGEEQDLYAAHEVLQMIPLIDKHGIYTRFLQENSWVKHYLYNAWEETSKGQQEKNEKNFDLSFFLLPVFFFLEFPAKCFQLWHMQKHRTTEKVSDAVVRFHPKDIRVFIRQKYPKLLRKYKIPLDRRFFFWLK
jgi:predicted nucleotidyltransferase